MKALILNSGLGSRMESYTKEHPKCMTELTEGDTILSRQLKILRAKGINEIVITTGYFDEVLMKYCNSLGLKININFVNNPLYDKTNYIYSIYLARKFLNSDLMLLHGDLVFEEEVLDELIQSKESCMKISSTVALPEKDFKAVLYNGRVTKVGVEFFDNAVEAQPIYKLKNSDLNIWMDRIIDFCENGKRNCYAEVALNEVTDKCCIMGVDAKDLLCTEIDTPEDLMKVREKLR